MFNELVHHIYLFVVGYGLLGIFVLMLVENIGIPAPTEIGFVVGQSMVLTGRTNYLELFLVILAGKTVGSVISYIAGRYFASRIKVIRSESSRLKAAQATFTKWMKKYGNFAVFLSRVVGYIRPWSSYLAGIGEIKPFPFIFYNVTGSVTIIALTMVFLGAVVELWKRFAFLRPTIAVLSLVAFFGFWVFLSIYVKRKKAEKINRTLNS